MAVAEAQRAAQWRARPSPPAAPKVALFTGNYNYVKEGANQALNLLADHVDATGGTLRAYSPVTATPAFAPSGTLVPVPSVPLPGRSEFRLALRLPPAIRRDVRAFAPDLVHVATPDILGVRAQSFARQLGVPVVASLHTRFETYFEHYGLGWLRGTVERHLDRFYARSDLILAPTPSLVALMAARHGAGKVRLWARGVDTDLYTPTRRSDAWRRAHGIAPYETALLFFGRLVLEKGTNHFAEIVEALRATGHPVRPVIVGEGPARARLAEALPTAVFTGHIAGAPLATAIASCDILINPSLTETFGNVNLEAMASGLAIVAADVSSVTNLITDGHDGLLCGGDVLDYVAQADRLVRDPGLRAKLGRVAREAAMAWRWEDALADVTDAYTMLLAGGDR
jgi:phosphatidylinositol alpha 1,6-mannosyltransferase